MLGIGFLKLLLLAAVVTAVWYGFRWLERSRGGPAVGRRPPERRVADSAIELERNPATGAYEPRRRDGEH